MLNNGLNWACSNIAVNYMKVEDESMIAIRFQKTSKGDIINLFYMLRKPETLETEFETVSCSITVSLIKIIGIKRRDEAQKVPAAYRSN